MAPDDEQVRGALKTLLDPEPAMRSTVADDVRLGRRLRARRGRRLAGVVAAALVLGAAGVLGIVRSHVVPGGPAGGVEPGGTGLALPTPTPGSTGMVTLTVPQKVPGEISRAVYPSNRVTDAGEVRVVIESEAVEGQHYVMLAGCLAPDRTTSIGYRARTTSGPDAGRVLVSGEIPCDGTTTQLDLPSFRGSLQPDLAVTEGMQAYAVVVPRP